MRADVLYRRLDRPLCEADRPCFLSLHLASTPLSLGMHFSAPNLHWQRVWPKIESVLPILFPVLAGQSKVISIEDRGQVDQLEQNRNISPNTGPRAGGERDPD